MNADHWYKEGKRISIDGHEVFFNRAGQGEHLICIHGFPTSSWDFDPVWSSLGNRFDVIAHDLIGLGKSAKPKQPLTVHLQANIVEGLAIKLGVTRAHILAHDLGDTIAQELLARQAEKKSKIKWLSCVFMNGGIFPETHRPRFIQKLLISPLGPLFVNLFTKKSLVKNMNAIFSKEHPPEAEFLDESWNLIKGNNGLRMLPRLIQYMEERRVNRTRWVTPLQKSSIPLLLINGGQDPISGKHMADRYGEVVTDANIILLDDAGHYPHVETPEKVLSAFFSFHDQLTQRKQRG